MTSEMTVFKALTTAGQAISSMAQCIKLNKSVKKQDAIVFQEQLRYIKAACRTRGYGELTRLSIEEMEKTLQKITQKNFSGEMYSMSMNLLNIQFQALCQNLNNYKTE